MNAGGSLGLYKSKSPDPFEAGQLPLGTPGSLIRRDRFLSYILYHSVFIQYIIFGTESVLGSAPPH